MSTTRFPRLAAGVLALVAAAASASEPWVAFEGEVERGARFERALPDGTAFRLEPTDLGFRIWIGDSSLATRHDDVPDNRAQLVTPPHRGPNHLDIDGWHFRNADNTGPNAHGPGNVNAPQELREFAFVTSDGDQCAALETLQRIRGADSDVTPSERESLRAQLRAIPTGGGELAITDLRLGNLTPGERAHVERMSFRVRLWLREN